MLNSLSDEEIISQIQYLLPDRSKNEQKIRLYLEKRDRESALHIMNQIMKRINKFHEVWPDATLPELFVAYRQSDMNIENCLSSISNLEVQRVFSDLAKNPKNFLKDTETPVPPIEKINSNDVSESSSDSDSSVVSDSEVELENHRGRPRRARGRFSTRFRGSRSRKSSKFEETKPRFKDEIQITKRRGRPPKTSKFIMEKEAKLNDLRQKSTLSDIWDEPIGIDENSPLKNISHEWLTDGVNYVRIGPESQHANNCMALNPLPGYTDLLTKTLMTEPQIDRYGYVLDKSTWNHWYYRNDENGCEGNHTHPFTNEPIRSMRDLDLQSLTLENIAYYKNKILAIDSISPNSQ